MIIIIFINDSSHCLDWQTYPHLLIKCYNNLCYTILKQVNMQQIFKCVSQIIIYNKISLFTC
jgi:hypothetical protein